VRGHLGRALSTRGPSSVVARARLRKLNSGPCAPPGPRRTCAKMAALRVFASSAYRPARQRRDPSLGVPPAVRRRLGRDSGAPWVVAMHESRAAAVRGVEHGCASDGATGWLLRASTLDGAVGVRPISTCRREHAMADREVASSSGFRGRRDFWGDDRAAPGDAVARNNRRAGSVTWGAPPRRRRRRSMAGWLGATHTSTLRRDRDEVLCGAGALHRSFAARSRRWMAGDVGPSRRQRRRSFT
jgi:hypothetical protein